MIPKYLELRANDLKVSKEFYSAVFGCQFTDYGPDYAAIEGGAIDIGFGQGAEFNQAPIPGWASEDLEAAYDAVKAAGGRIVKEIFAFPGGRRFQFLDPAGNELIIYQPDEVSEAENPS